MDSAHVPNIREVSFQSSLDGVRLHGTLTIPDNAKGAVLMIGGSGKTDRDETVPGEMTLSGKTEKLFLQLSDSLVTAGYATFRYDKRGVLDEDGNVNEEIWKTADRVHLISDAVDAAHFLSEETKLPVEDLVILAHSEGTIISVEAALALGGRVKSLLLFAAQASSMRDMLHFQIVEANVSSTSSSEEILKLENEFAGALEFINSSKDDFAPDGKPLNWYRQFLAAPANKDRALLVTARFAFFHGESDNQTLRSEVDLFIEAGLYHPTVFSYPGLGHCFSQPKDGKPTLSPIDKKVINDLQNFLRKLE